MHGGVGTSHLKYSPKFQAIKFIRELSGQNLSRKFGNRTVVSWQIGHARDKLGNKW